MRTTRHSVTGLVLLFALITGTIGDATSRAAVASGAEAFVDSVLAHVDSLRRARDVGGALDALATAERAPAMQKGTHAWRRILWQRPRTLLQSGEARRALDAASALVDDASSGAVDSTLWAGALYWRARALDALGRGDESTPAYRDLLRMARVLGDTSLMARGETFLARRLQSEGDLDGAAARLDRADTLLAAIGDEQQRVANLVLAGLVDLRRGHVEEGVDDWRQCVEASRDWPEASTYVNCLTNVATYEALHGDPAEAVRCWRRARDVSIATGGRWRDSIRPSTNLALMEADLGNFDPAIAELEAALTLTREKGYADLEGGVLSTLAEVEWMRGDARAALARYRDARPVVDAHGDSIDRFWVTRGIAMSLARTDSTQTALAMLDALQDRRAELAPLQKLHLDVGRVEVLVAAGRADEAIEVARAGARLAVASGAERQRLELILAGVDALASVDAVDSTIAWLERAAAVFESVREVPTDGRWREKRNEFAHRIFPALAARRLHRDALDAASVYAILQPYKARTLLERITRPGEAIATDDLASLPTARIQSDVLRDGELLLDYAFGPERGFLVAVSTDSCALFELEADDDLGARVARLAELLRTPSDDPAFLAAASARLRDVLLPPSLRDWPGVERLLVSPDGPMLALPLRGLLDDADRWARIGIQRVPSVGVLARWRSREDAAAERRVIALAAVDAGLRGAVREVTDLAARFHDVERRALGEGPDPVAEDGWNGAALVHVASHARFVDDDPWRSSILFDANDALDGGDLRAAGSRLPRLTATDVLRMRLDADLVVLSSCESMGEERFRGAGALGLSSAFLSAGARSVIATLWPIDDATTADFMRDFYRAVAEGHSPVTALVEAQDAMRSDHAHPFHWAGFVLVGDDPGDLGLRVRRASFPWPALGVVLILTILAAARRRRRHDPTRT